MRARFMLAALLLALVGSPAPSHAVSVFHSPTNNSNELVAFPLVVPAGSSASLHLFVDPQGDTVFVVNMDVSASGGLDFQFACALVDCSAVPEDPNDVVTFVSLGGGDVIDGDASAFKIGTFVFGNTTGVGDQLTLDNGDFLINLNTETDPNAVEGEFPSTLLARIAGCGDGMIDPGEVCDGAEGCTGGETCNSTCDACQGSGEPLSKGDQKCVNEINKNVEKVAKALNGDINKCIKEGSQGKLSGTIEECITSDPKGKVSKATGKLTSKVGQKCLVPPAFPAVDPSQTSAMNARALLKDTTLVHKIFGSNLDDPNTAILSFETDKENAKCQQAVYKQAAKCQSAKLKSFNACKKDGLKGKVGSPFTSSQELQNTCMGTGSGSIPDGKGKIAKDCGTKLSGTISKKCLQVDLFAGCAGVSNGAELAACIDQLVECEVCKLLNDIDGLSRDCDQFDDGLINGSCP